MSTHRPDTMRRAWLMALACTPFIGARAALAPLPGTTVLARLADLERESGGRLGVSAWNTANGHRLQQRAEERFPFCSTFKVMAVAAILSRSVQDEALLGRRIQYQRDVLVSYSPITEQHLNDGMTVAELCAAAIQYSDNTAANLLMKLMGGPQDVTTFARHLGDNTFQLERWETELNTAIPGDTRDTTTPQAMMESLHKLLLGSALPARQRDQLSGWMLGNTTGGARIRAGVPAAWKVADKTGTGEHGTSNDIAVLWPGDKAPIVAVIYLTQSPANDSQRNSIIARAAALVAEEFR